MTSPFGPLQHRPRHDRLPLCGRRGSPSSGQNPGWCKPCIGARADAPVDAVVPLHAGAIRMAQRSQAAELEEAPLVAELLGEFPLFPIVKAGALVVHRVLAEHVGGEPDRVDLGIALGDHVGQRSQQLLRMDGTAGTVDQAVLHGQARAAHEFLQSRRCGGVPLGRGDAAEGGAGAGRDNRLGTVQHRQQQRPERLAADDTCLRHVQRHGPFHHDQVVAGLRDIGNQLVGDISLGSRNRLVVNQGNHLGQDLQGARLIGIQERHRAAAARHSLQPQDFLPSGEDLVQSLGQELGMPAPQAQAGGQRGPQAQDVSSRVGIHGLRLLGFPE